MEVRNKMIQEQHQNDIKNSCIEKREIIEKEIQCSIEAGEQPEVPVTFTELMNEDEEIYKKLKIPWAPKGMQPISESKCIDSEKEICKGALSNTNIKLNICMKLMMD